MEIKGRLVKILPPITGQGRNGEWKKQEFVIELEGTTYPRKVCISTWGDKVNVESLVEGSLLNVFFDVESREYQGKWFTNVTAWKVEVVEDSQQTSSTASEQSVPTPPMPSIEEYDADEAPQAKDDLPF